MCIFGKKVEELLKNQMANSQAVPCNISHLAGWIPYVRTLRAQGKEPCRTPEKPTPYSSPVQRESLIQNVGSRSTFLGNKLPLSVVVEEAATPEPTGGDDASQAPQPNPANTKRGGSCTHPSGMAGAVQAVQDHIRRTRQPRDPAPPPPPTHYAGWQNTRRGQT